MKILLLRGNPRKTGISEILVDLFVQGVKKADGIIEDINLCDLKIKECIGCFSCAKSSSSKCIFDDDMKVLNEKLSECDVLICATPVYFYSMSAKMKIFWERCFPFLSGYEKSKKDTWQNSLNFKVRNKKFFTINIGSSRFLNTYKALENTWNTISDSMGFESLGNIVRSESVQFIHPNSNLEKVERIKKAFVKAGESIVKNSFISEEIFNELSIELSESDEIFAYNSNLFWQRLKSKNNDEKVSAIDLMNLLKEEFIANARNQKVDMLLTFTDVNESYSLNLDSQKCEFVKGESGNFDLKIKTTTNAWNSFIKGRSKILEQIACKEIELVGNIHIFAKLKKYFDLT